jgi:hypothetical protein
LPYAIAIKGVALNLIAMEKDNNNKKVEELIDKAKKISSMIYNLINYRKTIK